jgi:hypothetical protein
MKKLSLILVLLAFCFSAASVSAQMRAPLGMGNLAVKVDYFRFTDDAAEDFDIENGVYVGLEGYASFLNPNLYFGLETGWAGTSGDFFDLGIPLEVDTTYVPIELNAKYVFEINPCLTFDMGAGISMNYFNIDFDSPILLGGFGSVEFDDWVFGGQIFADINYKVANWFVGANAKFQMTDDLEIFILNSGINRGVDASNFRVGVQAGMMF